MSGLSEALLAAQKAMPKLSKDSTADTGKFAYKYLSLPALLEQVLPVLNEHDLYLMQKPQRTMLETRITHLSGDSEVALTPILVGEGATPQQWGSALSYTRRYALISMLALAPDEDDDGAAAQSSERGTDKAPTDGGVKQSRPATRSDAPSPATEKPATPGQLAQLSTTIRLLDKAFPEHPGEGRSWADVAKEHAGKSSTEMSMAEANELNDWLEGEFIKAQQEAQVPFG